MATSAVNWSRIYQTLGLGKNTTASVQAFRKRAEDARRHLQQLKHQRTDVDIAHYKSVLKNQEVISQAEKVLRDFKPVTYDVSAQLKAIDAFEAKAVEAAQASSQKIEAELKDLKATLKNIQDARPFEQLTVDDVIAARPEIGETVEAMVKQGKWTTPQYTEKFGSELDYDGSRVVADDNVLTELLFFTFCRSVGHLETELDAANEQVQANTSITLIRRLRA